MTNNLQQLYKDIVDSEIEEKLKYAFLAMLETSVLENEEIVKNKIKRMLDEYIAQKDMEAKLLEKIEILEKPNVSTQTPNPVSDIPVINHVQPTTPTPMTDAQSIADIQNQLQNMQTPQPTSLPA